MWLQPYIRNPDLIYPWETTRNSIDLARLALFCRLIEPLFSLPLGRFRNIAANAKTYLTAINSAFIRSGKKTNNQLRLKQNWKWSKWKFSTQSVPVHELMYWCTPALTPVEMRHTVGGKRCFLNFTGIHCLFGERLPTKGLHFDVWCKNIA